YQGKTRIGVGERLLAGEEDPLNVVTTSGRTPPPGSLLARSVRHRRGSSGQLPRREPSSWETEEPVTNMIASGRSWHSGDNCRCSGRRRVERHVATVTASSDWVRTGILRVGAPARHGSDIATCATAKHPKYARRTRLVNRRGHA